MIKRVTNYGGIMTISRDSPIYGPNAKSIDVSIKPIWNYVDGRYDWTMYLYFYDTKKRKWVSKGAVYSGYVTQSSPSSRQIPISKANKTGSYLVYCDVKTKGRNGKWYKGGLQTDKFIVRK